MTNVNGSNEWMNEWLGNYIGDCGADMVSEALKVNNTLTDLDLSGQYIDLGIN